MTNAATEGIPALIERDALRRGYTEAVLATHQLQFIPPRPSEAKHGKIVGVSVNHPARERPQ